MKFTPKEIAELLKERPNQPHYIEALVRRAVEAEREACASLDVATMGILASDGPVEVILKYRIAIRERASVESMRPAAREERRAHDERYLHRTVEQTRTGRAT